jgi:hypothetical protein
MIGKVYYGSDLSFTIGVIKYIKVANFLIKGE